MHFLWVKENLKQIEARIIKGKIVPAFILGLCCVSELQEINLIRIIISYTSLYAYLIYRT